MSNNKKNKKMENIREYLKEINKNLSQEEKNLFLTEFLTMTKSDRNNLTNYLISKGLLMYLHNADAGFSAYKILCVVAIKNKIK